ncbi:MAG: phosphoenolpyruvate--protein phosphotransferase [Alphaproteobacteria bacterium]
MATGTAPKGDFAAAQTLRGLGVAAGVAIGPAHVVDPGIIDVPKHAIEADAVEAERERFDTAVTRARNQVEKLRAKAAALPGSAAEELGYLLEAHAQMLAGSRLVRGVDRRIAERAINAEAAVAEELSEITQAFAAMEDDYLSARVQDVRDVGARLLRSLMEVPYQAFSDLPEGSVIIADELTPADTALMDPRLVAGFATALGGVQGHTAIMARSLGLPAVIGVPGLVDKVRTGDIVVIDGGAGRVVVNPTPATLTHYEARRAELQRRQRHLARLRDLPAVTRDGAEIALKANLELPGEIEGALNSGAGGIGLLRTEFMYMNRDEPPSEDEQFAALKEIVEGMGGLPVTVRTLDAGSDKLAYSVAGHIPHSVNPALGLRAIRLSLKVRPLLENQFAAMLRAGALGPIQILLPMIGTVAEVRKVRDVFDKVVRRLTQRRVKIAEPLPPLGAMIEVPGAALAADSLARVCDFFSIGTNDLTMYTLAIDRGDEQVASLYDPLHPAVLRLIQFSTEAALRARLPVNVCGEVAGDPRFTPLLLGLGIRELSMSATSLPLVKQRIRGLRLDEATRRARAIMEQSDSGVIAALLDDFSAVV